MLDERLMQMGFNASEARIYLELLRIGSQPVSVIAQITKKNRTTTYAILKTLSQKGAVSSHDNGSAKVYFANDPNCLMAYLDSKRGLLNTINLRYSP